MIVNTIVGSTPALERGVAAPSAGNIIDPSRVIDWTTAGVRGGIPTRSTVFGDLVTDYSADDTGVIDATAALQSAHDDCTLEQVITIPAGTFRIDGQLLISKGITIRGAGMGTTILKIYTSAYEGAFHIGSAPTSPVTETAVTGSPQKGDTTITVASVTTPSLGVGDLIVIDRLNGAVSGSNEVDNTPSPAASRDSNTRNMSQICEITAVDGLTLTIDKPLYRDFESAYSPEVWKLNLGNYICEGFGLEDLTIERVTPTGVVQTSNMRMTRAIDCWVKDCELKLANWRAIDMSRSFHCTITGCYINDGLNQGEGGHAYGVTLGQHSSANLVENNRFRHMRHAVVFTEGASGNVIGYNYFLENYQGNDNWTAPDMMFHGAHCMFNLFEGNIGVQFKGDFVHGSSSYNTYFRNYAKGVGYPAEYPGGQGNHRVPVNTAEKNWYYNFVGNVLGLNSESYTAFEDSGTRVNTDKYIYMWGYAADGDTTASSDTNPKDTAFRHGNYDYQSDSTIWDAGNSLHVIPSSLYLTSAPASYAGTGLPWPTIGSDLTPKVSDNPAKLTHDAANETPVANLQYETVAAAVANASDGDTLVLPSGSATWNESGAGSKEGYVVFSGKALTIKGAGADGSGTNITNNCTYSGNGWGFLFEFTNTDTAQTRFTGIRFYYDNQGGAMKMAIRANKSDVVPFRIDNCEFWSVTGPGTGNGIAIESYGPSKGKGLIDNCHFEGSGNNEIIHNYGTSSEWTGGPAVNPGSDEALYVEDCTFRNNDQAGQWSGFSCLQSYNCARTVARYNNIFYGQLDQHGTGGSVGALWWELYNNDFEIPADDGNPDHRNQATYFDIRAGSGVIYNNTKSGGDNTGAGTINTREEDGGSYPELYQVGRTINQAAQPAYYWGNNDTYTPDDPIKPGVDGGLVQWDRDVYTDFKSLVSDTGVVVSESEPGSPNTNEGWWKPSESTLYVYNGSSYDAYYTPYVYPHPFNTGAE